MPQPPKKPRSNRGANIGPIAPETGHNFPETGSKSDIGEIDALFQQVGLVHHRREKAVGAARRARFKSATPEELSPPLPVPALAPNGVQWLPVPGWKRIPWLWNGFSSRCGGVSRTYCADGSPGELNLGFTPDDDRASVLRNRQLMVEAVTGNPATPLVALRQIHSGVLVVGGPDSCAGSKGSPPKGDGLMTDHPGILLGIQTADCIPVLVADRKRKAVAAFHAGWRGTVKRIVETGIGRMQLEFGSRPEDLVAAIGPGIGACCYAVGEEVLSEFESQFTYGSELFREVYDADPVRAKYPMLFLTQRAPGHSPIGPSLHVDLIEANRRQLLAAGLDTDDIQVVGTCTNCHPELFFSHRASRGRCGRMMSLIGIRA
jgi:YfiH family protein